MISMKEELEGEEEEDTEGKEVMRKKELVGENKEEGLEHIQGKEEEVDLVKRREDLVDQIKEGSVEEEVDQVEEEEK